MLIRIGGEAFLIGGGGADNPTQTLFFARLKKQICGTSGILTNRQTLAVFINLATIIQKMAKTTKQWHTVISKALKKAGIYNTSLEMQVSSLAGAMRTLELAQEEIDGLDTIVVMERTRYGEKMMPHPAFKIQRDAQSSITRQMKQLGLTPGELTTDQNSDPLIDLTQKLLNEK